MKNSLPLRLAAVALCAPVCASANEWNFRALLDGKHIGQHRFTLRSDDTHHTVTSHAQFKVRVFGISAYHYTHSAVEQWRNDCITHLAAKTEDQGQSSEVRAHPQGDGLQVLVGNAPRTLQGCVMTFAYWNPAIQTQTHLLNTQTGRFEPVKISRLAPASIDVRGVQTPATPYQISAATSAITVWYSAQGDWLGLDTVVRGKHKLSYRL